MPRGAAAILIRESAQQRRIQFLGMTANPVDAPLIGGKYRLALLRETAAAMELPVDEVVPTDDEFEAQQAAAAQAMQAQQQAVLEATQQTERAKFEMTMAREDKITERELKVKDASTQADVIKEAVSAALASHQEQVAAQPQQRKAIKYHYDDNGQIISGELE